MRLFEFLICLFQTFFRTFTLCNINACHDNIFNDAKGIGNSGIRPGNAPLSAGFIQPLAFIFSGKHTGITLLKKALYLLIAHKQIPQILAGYLSKRIPAYLLTGAIKTQDTPFLVKDHNQDSDRIQNCRDKVNFLSKYLLIRDCLMYLAQDAFEIIRLSNIINDPELVGLFYVNIPTKRRNNNDRDPLRIPILI